MSPQTPEYILKLKEDMRNREARRVEIQTEMERLKKEDSTLAADIAAFKHVVSLYPAEDWFDVPASSDDRMPLTDWVLRTLEKVPKGGSWAARAIGDAILKDGFKNPSANFHIAVNTACSRLEQRGKVKSVTADGKKLYSIAA